MRPVRRGQSDSAEGGLSVAKIVQGVDSRAALAATNALYPAFLSEAGREGVFVWSGTDLSAQVTADAQQSIYVAGASDATGASGAWVRKTSGLGNGTRTLITAFADAQNSTTAETDLFSYSIPAGELAVNGDRIEAQYAGTFVSSGTATRQLKLKFAGTTFFDSGALTLSLSAAWDVFVTIIRVSATVVRYSVSMTTEGAALAAYTACGELTGLTLSNANILKLTGTAAGVGAATGDIVGKMSTVDKKAV